MNRSFEDSYSLRAADFDRWENLRPASIMDLFQDIAGRHANILGVGATDLIKKNTVWVLVKQRFRVLKDTKMYQRVKVRTWPLPPDRVGYRREYLISDEKGDAIVEGSSEWVLMDIESRKIVPAGQIYPLSEYCEKKNFGDRFPRLRSFEPSLEPYSCRPPYSDFDVNGHVNNTKYPNFVLDAINPGPGEKLKELRIEYHREVLPGEELGILIRREGDTLLARGESSTGERMFSCYMEFGRE